MQDLFFKTAFHLGIQGDAASAQSIAPMGSIAPTLAEARQGLARTAAADKPAYIRMGRLLRDVGRLEPQAALDLAAALLDIGRPDEALDLLQNPALAERAQGPSHALLAARALAGVERFVEAEAALRQALGAGLEGPAAQLIQRLWDLIKRHSRLGATSSWLDFQAFIRACLDLGLTRPAVSAWRRALSLADGPLSEALDEMIDAAPAILRVSDAAVVDDILLRLSVLLPWKYDGRALAATAKALRKVAQGPDGQPSARPSGIERATPFARFIAGEACAASGQWRMAIDRFGGLLGAGALRHLGPELARCVGREVLEAHPLTFAPPRAPKVFDLFPFNGEFRMLEFKLAEMSPWVDHFVIVEAARTFTGLPKPLYFAERRDDFRNYADKIIHVVVDAGPDERTPPWAREFFQRDSAIKGLSGVMAPDDIVLLSDADEIVDPGVLGRFSGELRGLAMRTFLMFFNLEADAERHRVKAVMVRARLLASNGCSYLRFASLPYARADRIEAAGWHFSSIKAPEDLEAKARAYSHEEHAHLDRDHFIKMLQKIRSGAESPGFTRQELDGQFPAYLLRNREALAQFIL